MVFFSVHTQDKNMHNLSNYRALMDCVPFFFFGVGCMGCSGYTKPASPRPPVRGPQECSATAGIRVGPVSYTHLTLPTICSV